jgi:hypothetical protein
MEALRMHDTVIVALISAGASALVAVTALVLNYRGFASIDSRFASLDGRLASLDGRFASLDSRFASIERRLDLIQSDIQSVLSRAWRTRQAPDEAAR